MLQENYKREYSEIMEMFYGISFSELISLKTGKVLSVKPESYFMIDLPVFSSGKEAKDIHECFEMLTEAEHLEGDNAWYNEKTKTKENVKKRHSFWNFPNILIISFKRFSADGTNKMQHKVNFPLENLDLCKYVRGYNKETFVYNLFGICNHVGGVTGGHYTSFVKNIENNWIHYNDHRVEKVKKAESVITPMAYCLFYRKKNNLL
jgi:ubiquitin carboxyl-terminal hydrolase 4/11/15